MAIAWGGISSVNTTSTVTSVAVSGSNPVGFVYVVGEAAADNITAVTWNGVSMTKIAAVQATAGRWTSLWWVANPSSSTNIVFTGGTFWRSVSFYYTGASQTGQPDSFNTNTALAATSISVATTVVVSGCWVVLCKKDEGGARTDTGSNATSTVRLSADAGGIGIADSNATVSTGSNTGTVSISGGVVNISGIAFSIKPFTASSVNSNFLMFM